MDVVEISTLFLERLPNEAEFSRFCARSNLEMRGALDAIAESVGRRFLDGALSYEDGDEIMNMVWGFALKRREIPEKMYAIYEAFDCGECLRKGDSDDTDPVEKYTRPALSKVLGEHAA